MVATKLAYLISLTLIATGLIASLFHLGNPQRAWRALSQWRSSWLSREGVMAIATFVPLTLSAGLAILANRYDATLGFDQCARFAIDGLLHVNDLWVAEDCGLLAHKAYTPLFYIVFTGWRLSAGKHLLRYASVLELLARAVII